MISNSSQNTISHAYVAGMAARNLMFLRAIEQTLDVLRRETDVLDRITDTYQELHDRLESNNFQEAVDPDGSIALSLDAATQAISHIYAHAKKRHAAACHDRNLTDEDGVADAYQQYLDTVEAVHDKAEELRQWILDHDSTLQAPVGGTHKSVSDLFKAMGV